MAAPFALEDLKKLQTFVEFVSTNPSILNLPQLDFLKKFIEKFGGKIPEGKFEMPAGGKCPFGGDVKSESKATPPPAAEPEEDDKEPEMEEESEESEVELDMEANNIPLYEPNVLYLEEKPPKVVKGKKATASSNRKIRKKKELKKTITKCTKKSKTSIKTNRMLQEYIVKQELSLTGEPQEEETLKNMDPNDPLYTPIIEMKCEITDDDEDTKNNQNDDCFDPSYDPHDQYDGEGSEDDACDDDDDYKMFESKPKPTHIFEDDEDDEPLIMLTSNKGRPRKYLIEGEDDGKVKVPRLVQCNIKCKQNCSNKFTEEQRKRICDYFWHLGKEDKLSFIRKHSKSKPLIQLRRHRSIKGGNHLCFYLSDNIIASNDLTRVCRKYFEGTLCLSYHHIKKALNGYVLEVERDMIKINKENKSQEKNNEIKQILDPVTGNLITIDPKDKTKKVATTTSSETKSKTKHDPDQLRDSEHAPKPIQCSVRCIHKCHTKFSEEERKQICDIFWSMDYKRRKDFILANVEIMEIEAETTPEFRKTNKKSRSYHTRFFLRNGLHGETKRVCQHFMINTLCTGRKFISNAIKFADKTTGYYMVADRRGPNSSKISEERKQYLRDHIASYPTWLPNKNSKLKYLHHSLSIKKMFQEYKEKCAKENEKAVASKYYYKSFQDNFRLFFLANPDRKKGCGFAKQNPYISNYTGQEPGGFWLDSKGQKLDFISYNNHLQNINQPQYTSSVSSQDFPLHLNPPSAANQLIELLDPLHQPSSSSRAICHQTSV